MRRQVMASAAICAGLLLAPAAVASASTGDEGIGIEVEITPLPTPLPTPGPGPGAGPDQLTPTGGDVPWGLIALGAGALSAGILITRARRRTVTVHPMNTVHPTNTVHPANTVRTMNPEDLS